MRGAGKACTRLRTHSVRVSRLSRRRQDMPCSQRLRADSTSIVASFLCPAERRFNQSAGHSSWGLQSPVPACHFWADHKYK